MPTPSIQTLTTDAQQILNLDSISSVRSVVAVALANANTGTPLNPNLTTQQLWDQFYQVVTRPKSDIESIIANQLMKFLYSPPAPGGAGADKQVIFNDGGVLAGDADFLWNKTTNLLTVTGSATITGDLTVRTNKLAVTSTGVGVGTASPLGPFHLVTTAAGYSDAGYFENSQAAAANVGPRLSLLGVGSVAMATIDAGWNAAANTDSYLRFLTRGTSSVAERYRIASDGVATWSNVGGIAGTAMTLNSTGLGVGGSPSSRLDVANSGTPVVFSMTLTGAQRWQQIIDTSVGNWTLRDQTGSKDVLIATAGTGNIGIGVTPSAWNSAYRAIEIAKTGNAIFSNNASNNNILFTQNAYYDGSWKYGYTALAAHYEIQNGAHKWNTAASGTAGNAITWTQAMTLDASGSLLVGTTNNVIWNTTNQGCVVSPVAIQASRSNDVSLLLNRIGSNGKIAVFARQGLEVGDISVTTTGTTFNSTSDYRLKEAVQPLVGGLTRVSALKPSIYKWKSNGSSGEGFLAHELAEVVPAAVSGEKDAVNEDGSIKAQSIDMSRVVPILVAAIQELAARVQTLETR